MDIVILFLLIIALGILLIGDKTVDEVLDLVIFSVYSFILNMYYDFEDPVHVIMIEAMTLVLAMITRKYILKKVRGYLED